MIFILGHGFFSRHECVARVQRENEWLWLKIIDWVFAICQVLLAAKLTRYEKHVGERTSKLIAFL